MRAESTMHVLLLTNAVAPDKLGGLERYVRELAAQLVREGVQATVLARRLDASQPLDEIGDDGVRIVRHHSPSKASPLFVANYVAQTWRAGRRAIREHEPRIVHAHFPVSALAPALGTCRYLYTFHAPVYRELLSERHGSYMLPRGLQPATVGALRRAERLVVRRAARVVTLSEYMRGELRRLDAATADRAALIPGGVDVGSFSPATSGRHAEGAPLLFCARRLTPRTGVRELLHAMPAVLAELPHARLAVAGTGVMETELRRDVVRLQLERSVSFLGRVSEPELVDWYRAADLVLMPTQELEGFGLSTAEALACGTPVLGTPIGSNRELLAPLDPALLSDDASPAAIAAGVVRLARSPALLERVRAAAPAHAARFSWQRVAARYLEEYDALGSGR